MGLRDTIDGILIGAGAIKDIFGATKAGLKLDSLAEQAHDDYGDVLTDENRALYEEWKQLVNKQEKIQDADKRAELNDPVEKALMTFLLSIVTNASLPKSFRTEIKDTITEYQKLSNGFLERIYTYAEKTGNRMATTDEERAELQEFLDELRAAGEDDQS